MLFERESEKIFAEGTVSGLRVPLLSEPQHAHSDRKRMSLNISCPHRTGSLMKEREEKRTGMRIYGKKEE